jgi:hypothetical protein
VKAAEELRLNTSIKPTAKPKRLGVLDGDNAGFPNGRRLTDDVIDEALQVVEGELVGSKNDLGDAVDANEKGFGKTFPYLANPTRGSRGAVAKTTGNDVRNQLGDGILSGSTSGMSDTTLIAASAAAGAAGFLLITAGLMWWRRRNRYQAY